MSERRSENIGTVLIVAATAFSAIAVLVFQALGSRTLGTDGFAPIAVIWTMMFLIYTVLQLPAEQHLTRALVVTRDPIAIRRVRRDMLFTFAAGTILGVGFVAATLDRFFEGNAVYLVITAGIIVSRSVMAAARGSLAGHRRFTGYAGTIGVEAAALLAVGATAAMLGSEAILFALALVIAPLATLATRPFAEIEGHGERPNVEPQPAAFLAYLVGATAASQLIIAGGPIAVSFVGGTAAAVSIYFTTFALLRGPVTSAYNLVARVLPDFTEIAHGDHPERLWRMAPKIAGGALAVAVLGALGSGLLLPEIVSLIYGTDFEPPHLAAALGGAGVGLGLGALFATQVYTAAARGALLATGWTIALISALLVLVFSNLEPIDRVALSFVVGEGSGLLILGIAVPLSILRSEHRVSDSAP